MNAATPVKEHANPWLAFGVVGVLQGGVYGQCTTYVSKLLGLAKKPPKLQDLLRGSAFAGDSSLTMIWIGGPIRLSRRLEMPLGTACFRQGKEPSCTRGAVGAHWTRWLHEQRSSLLAICPSSFEQR